MAMEIEEIREIVVVAFGSLGFLMLIYILVKELMVEISKRAK